MDWLTDFLGTLAEPEAHVGAYAWITAFLGHAALNVVLTPVWGWIFAQANIITRPYWFACQLLTVVYFFAWEGAVQLYGGGLADATVDTAAWFLGGLLSLALIWASPRLFAGASLALAFVGLAGIAARMRRK